MSYWYSLFLFVSVIVILLLDILWLETLNFSLVSHPCKKQSRTSKDIAYTFCQILNTGNYSFKDYRDVVHSQFFPEVQTVNEQYYLGVIKRLRESVRWKRQRWKNNPLILHHDNTPAHTSILAYKFFYKKTQRMSSTKHSIRQIRLLGTSFQFPKLKLPLRGKLFESIKVIKQNSQKELKASPESVYKICFDDWIIRWHKCNASNGACFEGDKIILMIKTILCSSSDNSRYLFDRIYMYYTLKFTQVSLVVKNWIYS